MCRFKSSDGVKVSGGYSEFQYILCVGSRFIVIAVVGFVGYSFNTSYVSVQVEGDSGTNYMPLSFNTSYVSVQVKKQRDNVEVNRVSIHPMCRFKKWSLSV